MCVNKFGLIGYPLGHSLSPFLHGEIMEYFQIQGTYDLYEISPADLETKLPKLMRELTGFNCTIPHKIKLLDYLPRLDPMAQRCQAVNTVYQGCGYNTDWHGFEAFGFDFTGQTVLILGSGGVAQMMAQVAISKGARQIIVTARNQGKVQALVHQLQKQITHDNGKMERQGEGERNQPALCDVSSIPWDNVEENLFPRADIVLNGTPMGMWPHLHTMPTSKTLFTAGRQESQQTQQVVFDSIYNPLHTKWLLQASQVPGIQIHGGLPMLFGQAMAAQKIWNPTVDFSLLSVEVLFDKLALNLIQNFPVKYVLTGFMGAGKTTVAKILSKELGIPYWDLDREIEQKEQKEIKDIFALEGEAGFRQKEKTMLEKLLRQTGSAIISTGGGAIIQPGIQELVEQNQGLLIYLKNPWDVLWSRISGSTTRPLVKPVESFKTGIETAIETEIQREDKVKALFHSRQELYEQRADLIVNGSLPTSQVIESLKRGLGYKLDKKYHLKDNTEERK